MNLPQNIKKTDGDIARSFSEELGLKLNLKTERKAQFQSSEHIGGNPLLMKNKTLIVNINKKNFIHIWSVAESRLLNCIQGPELEISKYFKLNEELILMQTPYEIGVFDINTEEYTQKILFQLKPEEVIFDNDLKLLGIAYYKEKIQKFEIYDMETAQLVDNVSLIDFPYQPIITFAKSSKVICMQNEATVRIYDLTSRKTIKQINVDYSKSKKVLDYKAPGILICQGDKEWVYELKIATNIYTPVFKYVLGVYTSKEFFMTYTSGTGYIELSTYDISNYIKLGTHSFVATGVSNLNFCNGYIMGYRKPWEKSGFIFAFDRKFKEVIALEFTVSLKLYQFDNQNNLFGFIKGVFNINNGKFHQSTYRIPRELNCNWVKGGHVVLGKGTGMKNAISVLFENFQTGEIFQTRPFQYENITNKVSSSKISIDYLDENKIWLFKIAGEYFVPYDAHNKKEFRSIRVRQDSFDKLLFLNENKYALYNELSYSAGSGSTLKLQILSVVLDEPIAEYQFQPKTELNFNYFINYKQKEIILLELSKNNATNKYELWYHLFDYNLNKLEARIIQYYDKNEIRLADAKYNEHINCIVFKSLQLYDYKLYKLDLTSYVIHDLFNFEEYNSGKILLSSDGAALAMAISKGIHIYNLKNSKKVGFISKKQLGKYFFSSDSKLLITEEEDKINFYSISPFNLIASMYVEINGDFYIEVLPDKTSPNGWFYTNAPEKVNILKTKADGSKPELLAVNDEERLAFIKHHNRKEIVLNRLFNSDKYMEFMKLNASAIETAKNDMAIELGQIEMKKIEQRK